MAPLPWFAPDRRLSRTHMLGSSTLSLLHRQLRARAAEARSAGLGEAFARRRLRSLYRRRSNEAGGAIAEAIWRDAANELGAEMRVAPGGRFEFSLAGRHASVVNLMTPVPFADRARSQVVNDKAAVYALLERAGIPVARHRIVAASDHEAARDFLEHERGAIVVKPIRGGGGAGVIGSILAPRQLEQALRSSATYADELLVERHVSGDSYRVLVLDGAVLDVVRRFPPVVVGDGSSAVRALMRREYVRRIESGGDLAGYKPFELDLDAIFTLAFAGATPETVVPLGHLLSVKTATNYSGPERSETFRGELHDSLLAHVQNVARLVGLRLAGVDLVTNDPARPLTETGGAILEVDVPGLHHHYNVVDRVSATRVAVPVLAAMLEEDDALPAPRRPASRARAEGRTVVHRLDMGRAEAPRRSLPSQDVRAPASSGSDGHKAEGCARLRGSLRPVSLVAGAALMFSVLSGVAGSAPDRAGRTTVSRSHPPPFLSFLVGKRLAPGVGLATISCGAASSCFALDARGRSYRYTQSRWSGPQRLAPSASGPGRVALSCAAAGVCSAAPTRSDLVTDWNGERWSTPLALQGAVGIESVGCARSGYCAAVDGEGNSFALTGGVWQRTSGDWGSAVGISCVDPDFCVSVGPTGIGSWDGARWTVPNPFGATSSFTGVSCPRVDFCVAVDSEGQALQWRGSSWSAPLQIEPADRGATALGPAPSAISCPTSSFCVAADSAGGILEWRAGRWVRRDVDGARALTGVACPTASFCLATDASGAVLVGRP